MMKLRESTIRGVLLLTDWLIIGLGLLVAYSLRQSILAKWYQHIQPPRVYLYLFLGSLVLFSFIGWLKGVYNWQFVFNRRRDKLFWRLWETTFLFGILIMSASYLVKYDFSRGVVIVWWLLLLVVLPLLHLVVSNKLASHFYFDLLIVGDNSLSKRLLEGLRSDFIFPLNAKLVFSLPSHLRKKYTEIVITSTSLTPAEIFSWMDKNRGRYEKVSLALNIFPRIFTDPSLHLNYDSLPRLSFSPTSRLYALSKRSLDLLFSSIFIFLSFPLWLAVGSFIYSRTEDWPIIGLWRVGYKGQLFKMYKFRTMRGKAKAARSPRRADDPRIYPWGRWLRRSSLDELPQLINILKGEMSLVGPRPEMEMEVKKYQKWQKIRLQAKPGLTGLWQILGRKDLPLKENLEYDLYYVANQSLWLDLWILLRTPWAVLSGRGAY